MWLSSDTVFLLADRLLFSVGGCTTGKRGRRATRAPTDGRRPGRATASITELKLSLAEATARV
jgi:hypothetical protein